MTVVDRAVLQNLFDHRGAADVPDAQSVLQVEPGMLLQNGISVQVKRNHCDANLHSGNVIASAAPLQDGDRCGGVPWGDVDDGGAILIVLEAQSFSEQFHAQGVGTRLLERSRCNNIGCFTSHARVLENFKPSRHDLPLRLPFILDHDVSAWHEVCIVTVLVKKCHGELHVFICNEGAVSRIENNGVFRNASQEVQKHAADGVAVQLRLDLMLPRRSRSVGIAPDALELRRRLDVGGFP